MDKLSRVVVLALVSVTGIAGVVQPVAAEEGQGFLTARRSLGLLFIGGSAALVKQGFDFNSEADELYARYQAADTAEDAVRLYERTNNRDVKSQVSWALAAAFTVSGVRLLLQGGEASARAYRSGAGALSTPRFAVEPQLAARRIGLVVKRSF